MVTWVQDAGVVELIARKVQDEKCILFLGAGVHASPSDDSVFAYPVEDRPPIGSELSRKLADETGFAKRFPDDDVSNLQRVSLDFEIQRSRRQLVDVIRDEVQTGRKPSPMLHALAELPFPVVMTTNYDTLFETALRDVHKECQPYIYSPNGKRETPDFTDDPTPERPIVFKLHGDVSQMETIVVTDEDYIDFVLRMRDKDPHDPIPLSLKVLLRRWPTLFVGYSLRDYNLRLLFKTLRWGIDRALLPDTYSVDYRPDPLILDVWYNQRRQVQFVAQDVWAFVPTLYHCVTGKELQP
jgi:hypothetical protein